MATGTAISYFEDRDGVKHPILSGGVVAIDSVPTEGSSNPVASGGVYDALQLKADAADLDDKLLAAVEATVDAQIDLDDVLGVTITETSEAGEDFGSYDGKIHAVLVNVLDDASEIVSTWIGLIRYTSTPVAGGARRTQKIQFGGSILTRTGTQPHGGDISWGEWDYIPTAVHYHEITDVSELEDALDGKMDTLKEIKMTVDETGHTEILRTQEGERLFREALVWDSSAPRMVVIYFDTEVYGKYKLIGSIHAEYGEPRQGDENVCDITAKIFVSNYCFTRTGVDEQGEQTWNQGLTTVSQITYLT